MFSIAVVDDDQVFIEYALFSIKRVLLDTNITGECKIETLNNGFSLIENYKKYDLVLLDIDMPMIDGIKVAEKLNELKSENYSPHIVFVTSKDHLVFDALKQYPFSFIRKSHFKYDIEECIKRVMEIANNSNDKYSIKSGRNVITIFLNEILYMEKDKNYIVIHMSDCQYRERGNIETKQKELFDRDFIRTHIGYLINLNHVIELDATDVVLDNGAKIPISRNYKQRVREQYFDWMVKHR